MDISRFYVWVGRMDISRFYVLGKDFSYQYGTDISIGGLGTLVGASCRSHVTYHIDGKDEYI